MGGFLDVESPLDIERLTVAVPDVDRVQFREPLTEGEYGQLAQLLERNPGVTLRAYGSSVEVANLRFLRFFPRLRRLSVEGLSPLTDVTGLNSLPDDLEFLDLGETKKPVDLRGLKFQHLMQLRVNGHHRGLTELVGRNRGLKALTLWRLKVDQILPTAELPNLDSLAITLGSIIDPNWLRQFPSIRHLALRRVGKIDSLDAVTQLPSLEWLWVEAVSGITHLPDLGNNKALARVDLDGLRNMKAANALEGLAAAPNLDEIAIADANLRVEAFECLVPHPRLSAFSVGLGSVGRNREVEKLLDKATPRSFLEFAEAQRIALVL